MKTLVIAPHADDEMLGCGGTLLRRTSEGGVVGWLLMTEMMESGSWTFAQREQRRIEVEKIRDGLGIELGHLYSLGFPASELDCIPKSTLIARISEVFKDFQPSEVLLPYPGDVHSDHRVTFEASCACTKWFRYSSVKRVLAYETPSETDFGINPLDAGFDPNMFVDISSTIERKLELMRIYASEIGVFPFPRSETSLRALAQIRGAQVGVVAAEGFMLLRSCE